MSPFDVWLALVVLGVVVGFATSVRAVCLDLVVGTNKAVCRKKYKWIEWGDVAPKSAVAMILLGLADVVYWGIRELVAQRGVPILPPEGSIEYAMAWGGILTIATGVAVLAVYLPAWSLRN
jgi:hypothetical protein